MRKFTADHEKITAADEKNYFVTAGLEKGPAKK